MALKTLVMAALLSSAAAPALADDWRATRLRGVVLELVDGDWRQLSRGDVVPDDRVVRTLRTGRVTLERGGERIDLGADTQVQIFDRSGRPFTTVKQYFGAVGVEANARNVEHFSVQTPHMTAVVKGTRFTVRSDRTGADVEVQRGRVAVRDADSGQSTLIGAGQSAQSGQGTPLQVSGAGQLPAVYDAKGKPVRATGSAEAAAAETYAAVLAAGGSVKQAQKAAKVAEKAAEKSERALAKAAEKAAKTADKAVGAAGGTVDAVAGGVGGAVSGLVGGGSNANSGNGNSGNDNSGGTSGNGSGGGNGNGNSGNGNSGNGNSGNGNSGGGNGNSGNGNSGNGNGNQGQGGGVGGLLNGLL